MTPLRVMYALLLVLVMICILISAGCISQPATENRTRNASVSAPIITPVVTPVQIQCPPQKDITPWIIINPVSNHYVGDVFEINGTTNLKEKEELFFNVYEPPHTTPYQISPATRIYSGEEGVTEIMKNDCRPNIWSFLVNTSGFRPSYYHVLVSNTKNTTWNETWNDTFFTIYPVASKPLTEEK